MTDRVDQQLGNYRLLRLLGRGGFADVYLGEHIYLQNHAALKVLHTQLSEQEATQFVTEGQTLARLTHPHIVRVLDFAVQDGTPFLVLEYAPGGSLRTRHPRETRLTLDTIVRYVSQVASALQYAHHQRLLHRDVKPENMLLGARDEVLLGDFGLAMFMPHTRSRSTQAMEEPLTGTTPYLAPEQLQGRPQPASDQYALGIVVYEWICGRRPFSGSSIEIAMQHLSVPPPRLCEHVHDLPPAVEEVVLRALAKDPGQRFPSVRDFADALQHAYQVTLSPHATLVAAADRPASSPLTSVGYVQEQALSESISTPAAASPAGREEPQHASPPELVWKVPTTFTPLIGRDQDVAALGALLSRPEVRLVTLLGTGGVGKTRLSIEVATRMREYFANGAYFVDLTSVTDPELVVPTIAEALGLREGEEQSLFEQVMAYLREKELLLLLDNFEQVVTAAFKLVDLLIACPQLKVLVTSRMVLRVRAEYEYPVPPLALPDLRQLPAPEFLAQYGAVALFLQRAQAIIPEFQVTSANARTIAGICARLDGLPLAIELAAARIRLLPPQALLARLSQRLAVLTSGARDAPARQQTLRNTIAWSYDLLNTEEQRLFRRLSVFVGGCTLEAVEAICTDLDHDERAESILEEVAALIDHSLLHQTQPEGEEPRFMILETIREYGLEALQASGEMEVTRQAHAAYYLRLSEQAELALDGPQQAAWLERLEREHDNLRTALRWSLERGEVGQSMELAMRLSSALWLFWLVRGHSTEGRTFLERALAGSQQGVVASVRAKALDAAAGLAFIQHDLYRGEVLCQEGLALFRELGDTAGVAASLYKLGLATKAGGNFSAARSLIEEAQALWRQLDDRDNVARSLVDLAYIVSTQGEYTLGHALYEESLALFRELGDKMGVSVALREWAEVLLVAQDDPVTVRSLLEESLRLARELGNKDSIAFCFSLSGQLMLSQGDVDRARFLLQESAAIFRETGNRWGMVQALSGLARVEAVQGDDAAASALYEESLAIATKGNFQGNIASGQGFSQIMEKAHLDCKGGKW